MYRVQQRKEWWRLHSPTQSTDRQKGITGVYIVNNIFLAFHKAITFKDLPIEHKFMLDNGRWYRKMSDKRAVKEEHPGKGNSKMMRPNLKVYVKPQEM